MAKRKPEEPKPGAPAWQCTFADLMNLLLCFFVLLFSMSSVDAQKFEMIAASFSETFSIFTAGASAIGDGVLVSNGVSQLNQLDQYINSTGKTADSEEDAAEMEKNEGAQSPDSASDGDTSSNGATPDNQTGAPNNTDNQTGAPNNVDDNKVNPGADNDAENIAEYAAMLEAEKLAASEELAEKIQEAVTESGMDKKIDITFTSEYVQLTLKGSILFDSGQAALKKDAMPVIEKVASILERYAESTVEIEGHTDNVPIGTSKFESNDVLSSYRALSMFEYLVDNTTLNPASIKHSGRGEYMPIADNSTPEGRAKNRRIEVKIYNHLSGE